MLVMSLNSGDILDLGGKAKIKVHFDPQGRSRVRLTIDGEYSPIKIIKRTTQPEASTALAGRGPSVYKPKE